MLEQGSLIKPRKSCPFHYQILENCTPQLPPLLEKGRNCYSQETRAWDCTIRRSRSICITNNLVQKLCQSDLEPKTFHRSFPGRNDHKTTSATQQLTTDSLGTKWLLPNDHTSKNNTAHTQESAVLRSHKQMAYDGAVGTELYTRN